MKRRAAGWLLKSSVIKRRFPSLRHLLRMGEIFISSSSTPRFPTTLAVSRLAFVANAYWAARMQTAQRIINHYRRNRFIVCTICALVTLILTLSIRFIS
ncbi:hypothetical protein, partial [Escherichia coli]|uniref:hypothetical protein n=1 Tax=Escherichia coli TaxID=562 RepID=UPI001BC85A16